jgi:mRNA interferase MazF
MTRGKIVLVPFPFDDLTAQKMRPAVCLTDPLGPHRHIVLAFITSRQPDEPLASDVVLDPQDPDFSVTGLQVRPTLRAHRVVTVASNVVKRELGSLSLAMQARVTDAVRQLFAV